MFADRRDYNFHNLKIHDGTINMNTAIYIRTSTDEQNPENQLKDCLSVYKEIYGEYEVIEEYKSAWKDKESKKREGFNKILSLIKQQRLKVLIVWDLDRIYRNRLKLAEFFNLCKYNNCKVLSFRQKFLTTIEELNLPVGFEFFKDLMLNQFIQVLGWIGEEESNKKSERIKNAMRIKDDGVYSYKGNKWGRSEISTQAINKILGLHKQGKSIRQICKEVKWSDKNKNVSIGIVHKIIHGQHRKTKNKGELLDEPENKENQEVQEIKEPII
jgi:DNA invertase Pin-like site-specific DNA recombinase